MPGAHQILSDYIARKDDAPRVLILGDSDDGVKAAGLLVDFIASTKAPELPVNLIMEGATRAGSGIECDDQVRALIDKLSVCGFLVMPGENAETNPYGNAATMMAAILNDKDAVNDFLENRRIPVANSHWAMLAETIKAPVIVCCGASHLGMCVQTANVRFLETGLTGRLGDECSGYAVTEGRAESYEPEADNPHFNFSAVNAIWKDW